MDIDGATKFNPESGQSFAPQVPVLSAPPTVGPAKDLQPSTSTSVKRSISKRKHPRNPSKSAVKKRPTKKAVKKGRVRKTKAGKRASKGSRQSTKKRVAQKKRTKKTAAGKPRKSLVKRKIPVAWPDYD